MEIELAVLGAASDEYEGTKENGILVVKFRRIQIG